MGAEWRKMITPEIEEKFRQIKKENYDIKSARPLDNVPAPCYNPPKNDFKHNETEFQLY